jgi:putative sterol carrier protein
MRQTILVGLAMAAGILLGRPDAAIASSDTVPQQVFEGMRQSFRADKAKGVQARYQFDLSGPHGGEWWIEVRDAKFKMGRGKIADPDVTFIATDNDWVALSNGALAGWWAHLSGRLKIQGSQALARKLDEMFP